MHNPGASIDYLYIKRETVGRGLVQVKLTYNKTTILLSKYLDTTADWIIQLVN